MSVVQRIFDKISFHWFSFIFKISHPKNDLKSGNKWVNPVSNINGVSIAMNKYGKCPGKRGYLNSFISRMSSIEGSSSFMIAYISSYAADLTT